MPARFEHGALTLAVALAREQGWITGIQLLPHSDRAREDHSAHRPDHVPLVEVDHEEVVDSRLRRYYRLTPAGGARLAAEAAAPEPRAMVVQYT